MPSLPTLQSLKALGGSRVLLRLDVNVPVEGGSVRSPYRLERSLATIRELRRRRAAVVILGHLGRPGGKRVARYRLAPIAMWLSRALRTPVPVLDPLRSVPDRRRVASLRPGQLALAENLRFYPGEEANDPRFAAKLATLGDAYVNDAFGASHRAHASVALLPKLLPAAAGLLLAEEVRVLSRLTSGSPAKPFVAVFGGAKVASKLPLLRRWLQRCDYVLVGGAMASTLLAAAGHPVGASPVEANLVRSLRHLVKNPKLVLPVDVVSLCSDSSCHTVSVGQTGRRDVNNDLGPQTVERFCEILSQAKTVVWNGPLGWFERPEFRHATEAVARCVARSGVESVVGGGETVEAIAGLKLLDRFSFVSTGGGAMMEFLEGLKLPGLMALGYYGKKSGVRSKE